MAEWDKITSRGNVDDRRGNGRFISTISLGTVALVLGLNFLMGGDLMDGLQLLSQTTGRVEQTEQVDPQYEGVDAYEAFASAVLGSANEMWLVVFDEQDLVYQEPVLVLFRQATQSGCGVASSSVGPHYCPTDQTIYLDETFFDELTNRFGARGGDVAEAYVIAHEVGHHAQHLLGLLNPLNQAQDKGSAQVNQLSIKAELQADCFAGLWAASLKDSGVFEKDEIIEAMDAAAAVGDDRIQETVTGRVSPESWTHGSSEARVNAFSTGYETGSFASCSQELL